MMSNHHHNQLALQIATDSRLSPARRTGLFDLLKAGDIDTVLTRLAALDQRAKPKSATLRQSPSAIADYIIASEHEWCVHTTVTAQGALAQLYIDRGSNHIDDDKTCCHLTPEQGLRMIPLAARYAFGILISGRALREIVTYDDGSVDAVCYGLNRILPLRTAASANANANG